MRSTVIILLAALATATAAAPAAASRGAFDPITATYQSKSGDYCIRSGWRVATSRTNRQVRAGDCRSSTDWARRGLVFERPSAARSAAR